MNSTGEKSRNGFEGKGEMKRREIIRKDVVKSSQIHNNVVHRHKKKKKNSLKSLTRSALKSMLRFTPVLTAHIEDIKMNNK